MSNPQEPPRILDAETPAFAELKAGLQAARRQGPSAEQRATMRAALGLPAAPMGLEPEPNAGEASGDGADPAPRGEGPEVALDGGAAATGAGAAPTGATVLKLIVGAAMLGAVALFGPRVLQGGQTPDPIQPRAATTPTPAAVETGSVRSAAAASSGAPAPVQPTGADGAGTPQPEDGANRQTAAAPQAQERPARRKPRRVTTAARAGSADATDPAAPADPAAELALLQRARAHAHSGPRKALALIAEHARRFPNGNFVEEAEVIAIEAQLAAGQRNAASARAERFARRFPQSAHLRRVRSLLAE